MFKKASNRESHQDSVRIAIVKAGWHAEIVEAFSKSCRQHLAEQDSSIHISEYEVPGVVEIPLFSSKLINKGLVDIVVVTGLIADHGVYRHDFVARTVMDATMQLQMKTGVPIIYGILTPQEFMSEGREDFFRVHFSGKGVEAAEACLRTLSNEHLLERLCAAG